MPNVHTTSLVTRILQTVTRIMSPRYKDVASATFTPLDRNVLDCHVYTIPRDQDVAYSHVFIKIPRVGSSGVFTGKGSNSISGGAKSHCLQLKGGRDNGVLLTAAS